jgi:hypothetical protein
LVGDPEQITNGSAWSIGVPYGRKLLPLEIFAFDLQAMVPVQGKWGRVFGTGNQKEVGGATKRYGEALITTSIEPVWYFCGPTRESQNARRTAVLNT